MALGVELIAVPKIAPNPLGEKDLALTNRMTELGRRSWEARKNIMSPEAWSDFCRKGAKAKAEKMRTCKMTRLQEAGAADC
jgi:hypothetical protein